MPDPDPAPDDHPAATAAPQPPTSPDGAGGPGGSASQEVPAGAGQPAPARGSGRGGVGVAGVRLAVSVLSVLPIRATRFDRPAAAVAMAVAPLVGVLLGGGVALILFLGDLGGLPALVTAALAVTAGVLLTRGLHLDGLADTVDAFGSYRPAAGALAIMKKPDIGPFGVAAVVLVLVLQVAAVGAAGPAGAVLAWTAGRLAVPIACRRGVPAARPDGLGALVAGTVPVPALAAAVLLTAGAAVLVGPWLGPAAVVVAVVTAALVVGRARRRLGGVTGDVIGAAVECATTAALVVLSAA